MTQLSWYCCKGSIASAAFSQPWEGRYERSHHHFE